MAARAPALKSGDTSDLDAKRRQYAHLLYRDREEPRESRSASLQRVRTEIEMMEGRLARTALPARERADGHAGLEAFRARLPARSALVSFVRYRPRGPGAGPLAERYLAFVLRSERALPSAFDLGDATRIDALVARWRSSVSDVRAAALDAAEAEAGSRRVGRALAQAVWDPLARALHGTSLALVVPDGALHLVAFGALTDAEGGYLAERAPLVHLLSSERDLLRPHLERSGRGRLLVLGGPEYGRPPSEVAQARSEPLGCGDPSFFRFAPLPGAAAEARQVADLWRAAGGEAEELVGAHASEESLKRSADGPSVVHFATHGFFPTVACPRARSPLYESGLALSGANGAGGGRSADDGLLTAAEAAQLDLRGTDWVVLSACGSGLGTLHAGEGVLGLRRAFAQAGAATVIASLWAVEDAHGKAFMTALYQARLDGQPTAEALRQAETAQRARLRASLGAAPPALWAMFVASGDWR